MQRPILALLLALPCASYAQRAILVHLPPGDSVAFASKGRAGAVPPGLEAPKGDVATVQVEPGQDTLYVYARAFNRVASAPAKGAEWSPKTTDLKDVALAVIQVRRDGQPVAAANVTLDDGRRKQTQLLDPGLKGDVTFFDVKPGSLKVTVDYRTDKGAAAPVTQIFEATTEKDDVPTFTVSLPEAAATIAPPASSTAAPKSLPDGKPTPVKEEGGFNFVGSIFGLLLAGAAAAGIWYFIKKNPDTVGGTLEKLGAQIPKPGDADLADPPVAAAPAPIAPAPPQKIVLDAAPDPIQMSAPVSVGPSEPSLVSDAGVPIPLPEGETVVGREIGLGLSLAGETTVSRRHARLVRTGGAATLFDEGSTNGTFVNGQRVSGSVDLRPGDAVQFGSVRFRYEG